MNFVYCNYWLQQMRTYECSTGCCVIVGSSYIVGGGGGSAVVLLRCSVPCHLDVCTLKAGVLPLLDTFITL